MTRGTTATRRACRRYSGLRAANESPRGGALPRPTPRRNARPRSRARPTSGRNGQSGRSPMPAPRPGRPSPRPRSVFAAAQALAPHVAPITTLGPVRPATAADLTYVMDLQRRHGQAVGFLSGQALAQKIELGRIWL